MKSTVFNILFLLASNVVYGKDYEKVIIPLVVDQLKNEIIKQNVISILSGNPNDGLYEYRTKCDKNTIESSYKNGSWMFCIRFSDKVQAKSLSQGHTLSGNALIDNISFFHMKYMLQFTPYTLSTINKEIFAAFSSHSITLTVKSYISKDKLRNYLHLIISSNGKMVSYVFIIDKSEFFQCIRNESS